MPQCAMTHSGSNSSALWKHFTPSSWLKPKHQFRPRSNQRCASADDVRTFLVWAPRSKRSIISPTIMAVVACAYPELLQPTALFRRQGVHQPCPGGVPMRLGRQRPLDSLGTVAGLGRGIEPGFRHLPAVLRRLGAVGAGVRHEQQVALELYAFFS